MTLLIKISKVVLFYFISKLWEEAWGMIRVLKTGWNEQNHCVIQFWVKLVVICYFKRCNSILQIYLWLLIIKGFDMN